MNSERGDGSLGERWEKRGAWGVMGGRGGTLRLSPFPSSFARWRSTKATNDEANLAIQQMTNQNQVVQNGVLNFYIFLPLYSYSLYLFFIKKSESRPTTIVWRRANARNVSQHTLYGVHHIHINLTLIHCTYTKVARQPLPKVARQPFPKVARGRWLHVHPVDFLFVSFASLYTIGSYHGGNFCKTAAHIVNFIPYSWRRNITRDSSETSVLLNSRVRWFPLFYRLGKLWHISN